MQEPIRVLVVIRNGVPEYAQTSLANPRGMILTVIQRDDDDTPEDAAEAEAAIAAAGCPNPLDY